MISPGSHRRERLIAVRRNAVVLIAYLAFSAVTNPLSAFANNGEALFSAAGVALGALLLFGFIVLPAVAMGAFIAALFSVGPLAALIVSSAAVLGTTSGYVLISKFGNARNRLRTLPQLGAFLFAGIAGSGDLLATGVNWLLSDSLSVLVLVPALFSARGLLNLGPRTSSIPKPRCSQGCSA